MCQNACKMHHYEAKNPKKNSWQPPSQTPTPLGGGQPPKPHSLCSNIVDENCYCNDVNIETETELKLFLKNFIETRTEKNSDTV